MAVETVRKSIEVFRVCFAIRGLPCRDLPPSLRVEVDV